MGNMVLIQPDYTCPFVIHVDVSLVSIGVALSQEDIYGELCLLECQSKHLTDAHRVGWLMSVSCMCWFWLVQKYTSTRTPFR